MTIAAAQSALARLQSAPDTLSLPLPADLPYDEWETLGRALGLMDRAARWWLSDWLNYGERKYGERYSQALAATGLAYQTLSNISWVGRQYESYRRRDRVSWSVHAEVAGLPPDTQDYWLDLAEAHDWSRARLRQELADARQAMTTPEPLPPLPDAPDTAPVSLDGSPIAHPWPVRAVADGLLRDDLPTPEVAHGPQVRAWCRCPRGGDVGRWAVALAERYRCGEVSEAVALVPVESDSDWWRALGPSALCLVAGWLDGEPGPWALCYLGPRPAAFCAAYRGIGQVWLPWEGDGE